MILSSQLHDEHTFYEAFFKDLEECTKEIIIESPFITTVRTTQFYPVFKKLLSRNVKIFIISRHPQDLEDSLREQAETEINNFEYLGIQSLLCTGNHHRKLAILDREILWEGSLNILSQANSREIMRRIEDRQTVIQTFNFLNLSQLL